MNKTQIEWVKNPDGSQGYTYARRLANGRLKTLYLANEEYAPVDISNLDMIDPADDPFYPRFWPERVLDPNTNLFRRHYIAGESKGIFVCDMGELFGDWIPKDWQDRIFRTIRQSPQHRFYLLTKQPQNLTKFSPFPENCWVGVTATEQQYFVRAVAELRFIEAKIKYLSFEPLLGHIPMFPEAFTLAGINQVIIGAQTKPCKPPKIEWVEEIVKAADKAGISVFLKDNLGPVMGGYPIPLENMWAYRFEHGAFNLRQEMPK